MKSGRLVGELPEAVKESLCGDIIPPKMKNAPGNIGNEL